MIPTQKIRKTALWIGVILPLLTLVGTFWVAHKTYGKFNKSFSSLTQANKTFNMLAEIGTDISTAETGRRGYLLTGRKDYLNLYDRAMSKINSDIGQLKILVADNSLQLQNINDLQGMIAGSLAFNAVQPFETNNVQISRVIELTETGRDSLDQIRNKLFSVRQQEGYMLALRQSEAEDQFIFDQTLSLVLVAITSIALIAVITILLRLEKLRQIVTICAWTGQVKHKDQWIQMDEYLKQAFGISVSHGLSSEAAEKMTVEFKKRNQQSKAEASDSSASK